jgi:parvulin-like peptidyl-prolyl isomerase
VYRVPREVILAWRAAVAVAALLWVGGAAAQAPSTDATPAARVFATVGDTVISAADYQRALAIAIRTRYYHARPPEAELAKFQREVGDEVVNRALLLAEARRRSVEPDRAAVDATLAGYDAQYGANPNWQANRARMVAAVRPRLEDDSRLERLASQVKTVATPTEAVVRAYYEERPTLFVEPEQVQLSVILLKVDPSSAQAVWDGAHAEARRVHDKLRGGADFAELARLHSGDRSAANGGRMEYAHRGMLPEALHGVVDGLQPGQLAAPVQMLEGVVVLRLDGRRAARRHGFDEARVRAAELWQRDEARARWDRLIAELRSATPIRIDPTHYAPLPATPAKARAD